MTPTGQKNLNVFLMDTDNSDNVSRPGPKRGSPTLQRVYQLLQDHPSAFVTAKDIDAQLAAGGCEVSRNTVRQRLRELAGAGILESRELSDGTWIWWIGGPATHSETDDSTALAND